MKEQEGTCVVVRGRGMMFEQIRRIGLAGQALAQLRADYERKPSPLVFEAIRRKIREIAELGLALEEQEGPTALVGEFSGW